MSDTNSLPKHPQIKSLPFAFAFNNFFVELSRVVTIGFYNDMHLWLVLAAVTNNSISRVMQDPEFRKKYASPAVRIEQEYIYIKLLPLSEIVGLPRTTVRRKVTRLMELGFVEHSRQHGYRIVKGALAGSGAVNNILIQQHALIDRTIKLMTDGRLIDNADEAGRGREK